MKNQEVWGDRKGSRDRTGRRHNDYGFVIGKLQFPHIN